MIKVAIIGTGWISKKMLDATTFYQGVEVVGIYSRDVKKTKQIAKEWGIALVYECFEDVLIADLDFVYLASPTFTHEAYLLQLIEHDIPVLCEKPLVMNKRAYQGIKYKANQTQTLVMEAMKTVYTPNFIELKKQLETIGDPVRVYLTFERVSKHEHDNPHRSALIDVGVYPITCAVELFGRPNQLSSQLIVTKKGMDLDGHLILNYDGFDVDICYSKLVVSDQINRIIGQDGTLLFEHVSEVRTLTKLEHDGTKSDVGTTFNPNTLVYELGVMIDLVKGQTVHQLLREDTIEIVLGLMDEIRKRHEIVFDCD